MDAGTKTQKIQKAKKLIESAKSIAVIPHHNPDGDAIGSALAAWNLLTKMGKSAKIISPNTFPEFLQWLPGGSEVITASTEKKLAGEIIRDSDLLIMADFNDLSRVKGLEDLILGSDAGKILIDHHPNPKKFADIIISDTTVSSTAELLSEFIIEAGFEKFLDHDVAECLYTGIITDTGSFSYNSSNPVTFTIVSALLKTGIDKDKIHSRIYNNFSHQRMQLLGYCLHEKFKVLPEYHTGYISITQEELSRFGFQPGDTEGFVNYPLSVKGVIFSALFIERQDCIKLSFRSKGNFPANSFSATHFNGGGHLNAAGGECLLDMDSCILRFTDLLAEYSDELKKNTLKVC